MRNERERERKIGKEEREIYKNEAMKEGRNIRSKEEVEIQRYQWKDEEQMTLLSLF